MGAAQLSLENSAKMSYFLFGTAIESRVFQVCGFVPFFEQCFTRIFVSADVMWFFMNT